MSLPAQPRDAVRSGSGGMATLRQTTPSKKPPLGLGNGGGGGARASSAPKTQTIKKSEARLAKAVFESQSCNRSMSNSRRKQRRYENDNPFYSNLYLPPDIAQEAATEYINQLSKGIGISMFCDWRSMFSTLFEDTNSETLERFRLCQEQQHIYAAGAASEGKQSKRRLRRDR